MYESEQVWRDVDRYFVDMLVAEDRALAAARRSSAETTMPQTEVAANQGKLLALLVGMVGARRVLEFGTLAGYSTIWLARAVGRGGTVTTLEREVQNAAVARRNLERAGVADRVEVIVGPAQESAEQLIRVGADPFDLVFIDADKPNNLAYLRATMELTRPGAVIVIDNVVRNGAVLAEDSADPRVHGVRTVMAEIAADDRLDATTLQTVGLKGWDGFTLAHRLG